MRKLLFALAILVPTMALADGEYDYYNDDNGAINIESNNAQLGLALNQDIDLIENSLMTVAPALSANGVDCNMISSSWSAVVVSRGKSKCEKGSIIWRDAGNISSAFGAMAGIAVLCTYKPFRKVAHLVVLPSGQIGVDCRKLRKLPPHKHINTDR